MSGQVRPRSEFRNGFKKLTTEEAEPAFFTEQRTRLIMGYQAPKYRLKISLQDVRIWGSVSQIFKADAALTNLHEGWGEYFITDSLSIKAGRMELDYDNARFLGNLGWAQQSRSHDLVRLMYKSKLGELHLGAAFNQDANTPEFRRLTSTYYSGVGNYKVMQYAWFHRQMPGGKLSILALNNGVQVGPDSASSVNYTQTFGGIGSMKAGGITLGGEFYYQTGTDPADRSVSAFLASVTAAMKLGKVGLTVGADYLSGTDQGTTEANNSFTPLYGTNHKFYGLMDYFYVGNPHGNVGLIDGFAKAKIGIGSKSALLAHAHYFAAAADVQDPTDATQLLDPTLGMEVDLVYNLNLGPDTNLKVGYSQLFGTDTMAALKGGAPQAMNVWCWAMLTFSPKFIK